MDTKINESEVVNYLHKDLEPGGMWGPSTCVSCYHVAIIMPYRDRYAQLRMLLHFLIPVLQRQHIRFRIFVVEQVSLLLLDFSLSVKAAPHECVIRTILPPNALRRDCNGKCIE